jgi:hypothetical protein
MLTWSARQSAMDRRQPNTAVHPAIVLTTQHAALPQLAGTTAARLVPTHVALTH